MIVHLILNPDNDSMLQFRCVLGLSALSILQFWVESVTLNTLSVQQHRSAGDAVEDAGMELSRRKMKI